MPPPVRAVPSRSKAAVHIVLRFGTYLLAFFLFFFAYWLNRYFGRPDMEQIAYHVSFGAGSLMATDPVFIRRFVRWCLLAPLLFLAVAAFAERPRYLSRLSGTVRSRIVAPLPFVLLGLALLFWIQQVNLYRYVAANFGPDYFAAHYIAPNKVELREEHPKNLVLIYVESLEAGYSDKTLFGADMLAPLNRLGGVSFGSYRQAPGTGWTIAALVATQCGVPLKRVTVYDENTQGEMLSSFLPNAICLSDILSEHGFRNVFMEGGSEAFAGKGKFLRGHHYDEIYGKEDWLRDGVSEDDMNGWGLFDDDLFAAAKRKLRTLEDGKAHFNLTLLTVDTHEPAGFLSKHCAQRNYQAFQGVVRCAAEEVADFVQYIEDKGYLANTNVVIIGDHLARKNPVSDKLGAQPERHIFNAFISDNPPKKNREDLVHFDLLPSILEFGGFDVVGDRMGLGYSAFNGQEQSPPADRFNEMQQSLMNRSEEYQLLWKVSHDADAVH
jgi:phosphoglycerol transferase